MQKINPISSLVANLLNFKVCKYAGYNWTCTIVIQQCVLCLVGQLTCINHLGLSTCNNYTLYMVLILLCFVTWLGMSKRSICPANQKQTKEMSQLKTNQNTPNKGKRWKLGLMKLHASNRYTLNHGNFPVKNMGQLRSLENHNRKTMNINQMQ